MARIAFAWELGGELGHAMACNTIGRALHARGHRIAFVFRELHQLALVGDYAAHDVFQAPTPVAERTDKSVVYSTFADIMLGRGYDRPAHLAGLLGAWIAIFGHWKPDLVVADFAPTALLAARALGLRRVAYGNGFSVPPRLTPMPSFRFDAVVAADLVREADARALRNVNEALVSLGAPVLETLAQQLETDEDFLATFPELDSYGNRPTARYWGPRVNFGAGAPVSWPGGTGKRIVVYVKNDFVHMDALIDVLAGSPHRVAAYIPGLEASRAARLRSPNRVVSDKPMHLAPLVRDCDLFVSHGGNVCAGALMAGVPQLVFPMQFEQYITARRIEQIGAGTWVGIAAKPGEVPAALSRVLAEPSFGAVAKAFALRYSAYTPEEHRGRIVRRIEEIVAAPSQWSALPHAGAAPILSATSTIQGASQ